MKILALEFSSNQRGVAISEDENILSTVNTDNLKTSPLSLIDDALRKACLDRTTIEIITLSIGPGSYTGIRSAIATAQGWELARNIKILPISSPEILAATARFHGRTGKTDFVINAQRQEYYHSIWDLTETNQNEITPLRIIGAIEATKLSAFGPDIKDLPKATQLYPAAAKLAQLAASRTNFQLGEEIEPIYLRATEFVKAPPPRPL